MFKKARLKLTAWYLVIIMAISLSFSVAIFTSVDRELVRMDNMRKERQDRIESMQEFIIERGFPPPQEEVKVNLASLEESRVRIITILGLINVSILIISGLGGYFLAGQTLDPISRMVKEQKEFVSNASHELRTPLTSLKTEIEVALRSKNMSLVEAKRLLRSNLEDVDSIQKLSNYLLKLNRFENTENSLKIEKIDLGKITEDVLQNIKQLAEKNDIKIIKHTPMVWIKGDRDAATELTTILVDNAIKYSKKGGKVMVTVLKNGTFVVKDYGIGIADGDIPHIFDRFYRADISRSKEKIDGYGLGLSIAKSISDRMGVKIKVQSKVGKGSVFSVQFPLDFLNEKV